MTSKSRNVSLPGAEPYPSVSSLPNRFLSHGFTMANALTLRDIRRDHITRAELERTAQLEMLDEIEELELVLQHYALTWGVMLREGKEKSVWARWGLDVKGKMPNDDGNLR